eukprot:Gregarina_sp_Poly_1__3985@NODE_21_length_20913_cov_102_783268_g19_i0_p27_GENE_NODE_21_length_20913_cov_102_783268_g19_i0NODE_21_length_20913_cov_102_783268_g19_i0_p27_ORF_typecomplete_len101_score5_93_NODE_21_length_20913_cov_102_783268_g19_i042344536
MELIANRSQYSSLETLVSYCIPSFIEMLAGHRLSSSECLSHQNAKCHQELMFSARENCCVGSHGINRHSKQTAVRVTIVYRVSHISKESEIKSRPSNPHN